MKSVKPQLFYYSVGLILALGVSLQSYFQDYKTYANGRDYNRYNNYVIFKNSFTHLQNNQNLYVAYDNECWDLYKYSPTFALAMAPFWMLPDLPGLLLWNFLNVFVLFFALSKINFPSARMKLFAHLMLLPEVITSIQNSQSNALIAGLMILGFVYASKNAFGKASLFILIAAFIKPFALVTFAVFLFFPGKFRQALWAVGISVLLFFIPLILIDPDQLFQQYQNWYALLQMDYDTSLGYSVSGWLSGWFEITIETWIIVLAGLILFFLPMLQIRKYTMPEFRFLFLSSALLWVILFNHKSESSTFIIAVSGVLIWYFTKVEKAWVDHVLIGLTFVFTCLIATDIFPNNFQKEYAEPYVIKVAPCILVWLKILWEMFAMREKKLPVH